MDVGELLIIKRLTCVIFPLISLKRGLIAMRNKIGSLAASLALVAGVAVAGAGPAQAAGSVAVNINCTGIGQHAWNAVYLGGGSLKGYNVYKMVTTADVDPSNGWDGAGGDFDWKYVGKMTTGSNGSGSTSTYYGVTNGLHEITVKVKINGAINSATKVC